MRSNQLLIFLAILAVIGSLLVSLYHLAYYRKIYPRVFVAQKEVSNLGLPAAEQIIINQLPSSLPDLSLAFGGQTWPLNLSSLGVAFQPETSAQDAYLLGRSQGLIRDSAVKWRQWWWPTVLPVRFSLDQTAFTESLTAIVQAVTEPMIKPALEWQSNQPVRLIPGRNGRGVDQNKLAQTILDHLGQLDWSPITMPVSLTEAAVPLEQLAAAQARAEIIKTKQLALVAENQTITIKNQELINLVGFTSDWDETEIASFAARIAAQINRPAQDAVFQFEGNQVNEFRPARAGLTLDESAAGKIIETGLAKLVSGPSTAQSLDLPVMTTAPAITTESVNSLGIKELLGQGESTFFGSIPGRKHNVALAASRLNGRLIAPGESFSFNQTVGDISRATGYQSAYIIQGGRTILGDGGGVCQVSSTLFRAVLAAGLDIIERRPHSYRVGYYEQNSPTGFDATVFAPSVDFKFRNDTDNYVLIQTTTDLAKSYLRFELYGTSDGRRAATSNARLWGQVPPPPALYQDDPTLPAGALKQVDWSAWGGKAAFDWLVTKNGGTLYQKTFYSAYQPWQAVFLRGTGGV